MYNSNAEPAVLSAKMYDTKVSVEYDHSDLDLDKVMDAFQTLLTGLGYHPDAIKEWIVDRAAEYNKQDAQSENNEWDVTLEDGLEDEDDYIVNEPQLVNILISKLKQIEVDGETMQYILEEVGMDEQMAIQLATMYPDVVEEHLAELKADRHPYVSDNFQIGPEGAYEHIDMGEDLNLMIQLIEEELAKTKKNKK